jgi:hypothetical protein
MCVCALIQRKITEYEWKNGVCGGNIKVITISDIYKMSICVYFGSELNHSPSTVMRGQVMTERNVSSFFPGELDNDRRNSTNWRRREVKYSW